MARVHTSHRSWEISFGSAKAGGASDSAAAGPCCRTPRKDEALEHLVEVSSFCCIAVLLLHGAGGGTAGEGLLAGACGARCSGLCVVLLQRASAWCRAGRQRRWPRSSGSSCNSFSGRVRPAVRPAVAE